jgi:RNA polymerase sigma factor (sigma-70 family)
VQDAYVAALERPPRGALRAWLGAVVRNLAGKVRRSEGRRLEREHAASRKEPLPGADDIAARIALHRSLVQAVDALEEPYRSTIVLRFFYDLRPQEVAARQGIPVETVRTRTRRALELLRGRVDRGALLLALLPLPALKTGSSALTLGVLMATKRRIVFALVLLLLMTGGMLSLGRRGGGDAARAPDAPGRSAAGAGVVGGAEPAADASVGGAEPGVVVLRGLVLLDGAPVEGARVALLERPPKPPLFDVTTQAYRPLTAPLPKALDETRTDPAGRFTLRSPHRAAFTIEALAPGAVPTHVLAYVPLDEELTIRLRRGAEVLGRVVDEAGAPVPRALVRWRSWTGRMPYIRGETETDAEGRFRVPGGSVWMLILAAGYAPTTADAEGASGIVLRRGGRVTGVVRDSAGAPVADAAVLLVTGSVPAETRTDAQGRYELRLGEGHLVHAMVHAPGRPPLGSWTGELPLPPRPVTAGGELTFDIRLPVTNRLFGTVVEDGRPVDAFVTLCRLGELWPVAVARARSDAEGGFAFDAVPAGTYELRGEAGLLFGRAEVLVAEGVEPAAPTVVVGKTGRVEGRVVGGVSFDQVWLDGGVASGFLDEAAFQADVDALGRFVFEGVAPGEAFHVYAPSPASIRTETFAVGPGETVRVTLDTSAARMLRGRVVDARGTPLAGALVAAFDKRHFDGWLHVATLREIGTTTGEDGRFAVALPEEAFVVVAYHKDGVPAQIEKADPDADLEIVLQPGRAVSGRVVWPGGAPARDVEIRPVGAAPGVAMDASWQRFPTGEFELRALGAGMVRIEVRHAEGVARPALVETGTRDLVIELRRTLSIRGAVIDRAGRPVTAAKVTAKAPGSRDAVAHSTQQGRFEIRGLDDGRYDLHLEPGTKSDWYPPKLTPFVPTVLSGVAAGTGDVVVEVDTGREVSGVVQGPDGNPVAKAFVAALGRPGQLPPTARTGPDGRFRLTGITGGHEEILVVASGFPPRAVALEDAMEIRLEAGESLRLRLLAPDGTPVRDQWISAAAVTPEVADRLKGWTDRLGSAQGAGWPAGGGAKTDGDGRAEIGGLFPGEYRVASFRIAAGIVPATTARTGGAELTVRLEAGCTISGRVVDRDGNALGSVKGKYCITVAAHRGETQLGFGVTGEDGSFEIEGLTRGPVRLTVGHSGPTPGYEGEATAEAPARHVRIVATVREE